MDSAWHLLPPELVELQIGQIDLLLAMYPDELSLSENAQEILDIFRDSTNTEKSEAAIQATPSVSAQLHLSISPPEPDPPSSAPLSPQTLCLDLSILFAYQGSHAPSDPPPVRVRVQQPNWMSKAATSQLTSSIPPSDDLLSTLDVVTSTARTYLSNAASSLKDSNRDSLSSSNDNAPLVRVWFYFPSISTRSKRTDLIIHAPTYQLTGFLYAGKPGLLCVEGNSQRIDDYMRFIKTESWGDIPAHHKKVSERHREGGVTRVFEGMSEITDEVGQRRGHRVNRGDMKAIEEWLVERGLGSAFAKVLM